jgi:hypothetical protein
MISDKYKCVHIHIPKCAGTSIDLALRGKLTVNWDENKKLWKQHCTALNVKKYFASAEQWNNYFKFSIVRNPFDRIVSSYNFLCRHMEYSNFRDRLLFKDFVLRTGMFEKMLNQDSVDKPSNNYHQVRPSVDYLFENDSLIVDYVGRFERLEDEWEFICEKIGAKIKLPHINKNDRKKQYQDYYNDETKEYVSKIYKKDIETFGYKF